MPKCGKCKSSKSSSNCSSSPDCTCDKCRSSSSSSCGCKSECKVCYGYWSEPRDLKCEPPCQYDYCKFNEIPTGSLYFAEHWDFYGIVRSLAAKQKYSLTGLVLQLGNKTKPREPYVLTVLYGGVVKLFKLKELSKHPLIISQGIRPKLRTCNKCVDSEQRKYLIKIAARYYGKCFETDQAQIARSIFGIPSSNPNDYSFTDTELVYRILYESALVGNCCPKRPRKHFSPQKCLKCDCAGNCESVDTASVSGCGCDCHPQKNKCYPEHKKCEKDCCKPCEKKCCSSSSSSSCDDCQKVDCYFASSVTICDLLTGNHMDMRWFWRIVPVFTECQNAVLRSLAINDAVACQSKGVVNDIRQLVECWGSGCSMAYHSRSPCECEVTSEYCGKSLGSLQKGCNCERSKSGSDCDCERSKSSHDGGRKTSSSSSCGCERSKSGLSCSCEKSKSDSCDCERSKSGLSCSCEKSKTTASCDCERSKSGQACECDNKCGGATVAIASLQAIFGQLTTVGTATAPATLDGTLLLAYFNSILAYLASICDQKVPPFALAAPLTTFLTFTIPATPTQVFPIFPPGIQPGAFPAGCLPNGADQLAALINAANGL